MKHMALRSNNREMRKKVEQTLLETVVHRRPFSIEDGIWQFVVFGPDSKGNAVIRDGKAEQLRIQMAPVYIATLGGDPHIPDSEGVPIEELAGGDVPEQLEGMKIFHVSPMRPLVVSAKRNGPPLKDALGEIMEFYENSNAAIIETPDEKYWALSVLKYLDESDRFFPDPVMTDFYSRFEKSNHNGLNLSIKH